MNLGFCASVIGVLGIIGLIIKNSKGGDDSVAREKFWNKEAEANFVRKKSLEDLDYITIPDEILSMTVPNSNATILNLLSELNRLSTQKIVNLTGISNTDLKLKYGTANITILAEYDGNYTELVVLLQKLADSLIEANEKALAIKVMEFSIATNSDISKTYYTLSNLYRENNTPEKCEYLIIKANNLNTIMKDSIVRNLKASGQ